MSERTHEEIVKQIQELLDTHVKPVAEADGGSIVLDKFENGIVFVEMQGACSGCPSSTMTLKMGIENLLMHFIPEVKGVEQINEMPPMFDPFDPSMGGFDPTYFDDFDSKEGEEES